MDLLLIKSELLRASISPLFSEIHCDLNEVLYILSFCGLLAGHILIQFS